MIDSHHHLWQYDPAEFDWIEEGMAVIRRSFLVAELDLLLERSSVAGSVAVQARSCLDENDFLLAQARGSQKICGVVGWVDLCVDDVAAQIECYAADPLFKGVREITQGVADGRFFAHPGFNAGVAQLVRHNLTYDLLIYQNQFDVATEFVDRHPDQKFVLDHAGKPEIRRAAFPEAWERGIRELAKREHLVCKLSGLMTEVLDESRDSESMRRYVEVLLDAFGPERLMFGSDWPVCLLASEYGAWQVSVRQLISSLNEGEQDCVFSETARKFYSL
ncbi:MAG: L-fuconolactonase [Verrucomicrobiales bacterium]|jgi:L-fuconolactonase